MVFYILKFGWCKKALTFSKVVIINVFLLFPRENLTITCNLHNVVSWPNNHCHIKYILLTYQISVLVTETPIGEQLRIAASVKFLADTICRGSCKQQRPVFSVQKDKPMNKVLIFAQSQSDTCAVDFYLCQSRWNKNSMHFWLVFYLWKLTVYLLFYNMCKH